jgi:hypothetical protein
MTIAPLSGPVPPFAGGRLPRTPNAPLAVTGTLIPAKSLATKSGTSANFVVAKPRDGHCDESHARRRRG